MIITREDCRPLSSNIEGKLVVIDSNWFKPEYREAKWQLVLAVGGFGCHASKTGTYVSVIECCENPESYGQQRNNFIGEPTEECVKKWKSLYGDFNQIVLETLGEGK